MFKYLIKEAEYRGKYVVWLRFNDGRVGEVDLSAELEGEIYEPLKDFAYFKEFSLRGHTLAWDNGADFAPEFLRNKLNS